MKYLKYEYWININSTNVELRQLANEKWDIASKEYFTYFQNIKSKFPSSFLSVYHDYHGFHDMLFNYKTHDHDKNLIITFKNNEKSLSLVLKNITDFRFYKFCLNDNQDNLKEIAVPRKLKDLLYCGYIEFELLDNNMWKWSILFDNGNEAHIIFSEVHVV